MGITGPQEQTAFFYKVVCFLYKPSTHQKSSILSCFKNYPGILLYLCMSYLQCGTKDTSYLDFFFSLRNIHCPLVQKFGPNHKREDLKSSRDFYFCPLKKKKSTLHFVNFHPRHLNFCISIFYDTCCSFVYKYNLRFSSCLGEIINI